MLNWIVGNKIDHPLSDIKEARAIVADLPPNDAAKALADLTHWIESLTDVEGFPLDRLFETIDVLDTGARRQQRKLIHDYLGMQRQQKLQENRLWTVGFKFAHALGDVYLSCVHQYQRNAAGAAGLKKHLPLVVARAIRAFAMQIKWIMLRYGPFEPRLWGAIGELYRCAEEGEFTTTPLEIYSGVHGAGTVQQEFLKVLMLCASSADVLSPAKQEIADRIMAVVASSFRVDREPFPGSIFCYDAASERRPIRVLGKPSTDGSLYYFSPGDAADKLAEFIPGLEKTGKLPADVALGASYDGELVLSVFKHLCLYWSDNPPSRASERHPTTARITVIPGFQALLDELEREDTEGLNFSVPSAESWVVENVSENGYGALIPSTATDWVRVGELIGVQIEGTEGWGVAVVRRVMRDEQRQYHVGMEVLSRAVHVVRVAHAVGRDTESAMLLSSAPDKKGEIGLVLRGGRFNPGTPGELYVKGVKYTIAPTRMVDTGDDFDWATYKVTRPTT